MISVRRNQQILLFDQLFELHTRVEYANCYQNCSADSSHYSTDRSLSSQIERRHFMTERVKLMKHISKVPRSQTIFGGLTSSLPTNMGHTYNNDYILNFLSFLKKSTF